MRARRALVWVGWAALGFVAAVGLALSALALLAALPATRPVIASRVVKILDDAIAGSLVLEGVEVLARGGIELRGLEVYDPDGHLVLSAGRARVFTDITGLRTRSVGVSLELEAPSVLLEEEAGGGVSLARAFATSRPGAPSRARGEEPGGGTRWTVHVSRLTVRHGDVWWVDAAGETRLEASALDLDARGLVGPRRARVDLRLAGELAVPVSGPISLELAGGVTGDAVRVPVLRAEVAGTSLAAVAQGDLARRTGRIAVGRLGIARETARAFVPRAPEGEDLAAAGYAESDGRVFTAAVRAEPAEAGGTAAGRADAAVAARLDALAAAVGFDVVLDRLDPARLVAAAPAGEVTLAARGALAGRTRRELRGRISATVERSRLRGGRVERAELQARADRGAVEITRARAVAPGAEVDATLRWREGGEVTGRASADARDLGVALTNAGALLGRSLARLGGSARMTATLGGTSAAPTATLLVEAPQLRVGGAGFSDVHLQGDVAGPLAAPSVRVEGRAGAVRGGGKEVARTLSLRGTFADDRVEVDATANLPGFRDPATLAARGHLGAGRETLAVSELAFAYPGTRWELVSPASVTLEGPAVDRLEIASGAQRVAIAGGLVRGRRLEARLEVAALDLARLPEGLIPAEHAIRGTLTADLSAAGPVARPELAATFSLAGGAFRNLGGLSLVGTARWDGAERRATGSAALARADGGTVDLEVDVPLPLAGRPAQRVLARARVREVPLEELLAAAGDESPAAGLVGLDVAVEGTAGAPALSVGATLTEGEWRDLGDLRLDVAAEDPAERLHLTVHGALGDVRRVALDVEVPLDVSELLERPGAALRGVRTAPLEGSLAVTRLDLSLLSGRAGVPPRLGGIVDGVAALSGSLAAPRATVELDLRGGSWAGYRDLSGRVDAVLGPAEVKAAGGFAMAGEQALRFEVSLRAPVERLFGAEGLRAAPLRVQARVPGLAIARAVTQDVPLTGTVDASLEASGTLRAPVVSLSVAGDGLAVEGRPLGKVRLEARHAAARTSGSGVLEAASGGTLRATFGLGWDLGLGAARPPLREAPAELALVAEALDLGFLPAVAPGLVRAAGGTLAADLRASGPLGRPSPRGTLGVKDGRLAVAELGEWTKIAIDARVTDDAVELARLEVHRGAGKLSVTGALRGLRGAGPAALEARLVSDALAVPRYGMTVATIDLRADARGSWDGSTFAVDVVVPSGVVRLPSRQPRELQSLEPRKDITVGRAAARRRRTLRATQASGPAVPERPLTLKARVRVDRNLFVKSDDPRVDVELKADVEYERTGGEDYMQGFVEVIRGSVEPLGGRTFVVERGRVQFTGGPPGASMIDVQARYDNPAAVVTVNVQGPTSKPEIQLHSEPPMDDAQIAMLIATGRVEVKAGSGGVGTLTGEEAGKAALAAIATQAFKDLVADKLPLDTVAIESGALRAGKYVTDKIYVGYTRRFDADPQRGENADEVRVEYQISQRWTFESRYGNAQSGGASLIWSRQY